MQPFGSIIIRHVNLKQYIIMYICNWSKLVVVVAGMNSVVANRIVSFPFANSIEDKTVGFPGVLVG